jgi:hypothetical protein
MIRVRRLKGKGAVFPESEALKTAPGYVKMPGETGRPGGWGVAVSRLVPRAGSGEMSGGGGEDLGAGGGQASQTGGAARVRPGHKAGNAFGRGMCSPS